MTAAYTAALGRMDDASEVILMELARPERTLLSEAELARTWGVCQRTVSRLRAGGLPYVALHVPGRARPLIRYDFEVVRTWLTAHSRGEAATSEAPQVAPTKRGRPRRLVTKGGRRA